jgi:SulP family sulfate permease
MTPIDFIIPKQEVFFPFLTWKKLVRIGTIRADALAGIVGALAVLPQAVAFATIAGLPPAFGLYAAIVPAIVAALFGSSKHLVSGPTTAISLVVFGTLSPLATPGSPEYVTLALTLAFLVGIMEFGFAWLKLGGLLNFISHTVIVGFTAGAACLIAVSQIKNFFGITVPVGVSFMETIRFFALHIGDINPFTLGTALVALGTGIFFRKFFKKVPYMIPVIVIGSIAGVIINQYFGIDTTHLRTVGALPNGLPPFSIPSFHWDILRELASPALAVTFLALTEAVAISQSIALRSGDRIDSNQEVFGQGLSNIIGSFFSAYPSSGSFNRSGLNFEAGAQTPLASIFAAAFLAGIVVFVAPLSAYLPLAVMAAVLFLVAWGLVDFRHIRGVWKTSRWEFSLLAVTFFSTLFFELEFAVFIGIFLSIALYLHRASQPTVLSYLPDTTHQTRRFSSDPTIPRCPQLSIVRIEGSLFFGSVTTIENELTRLRDRFPEEKNLLIVADSLPIIDMVGADFLLREQTRRRKDGGDLYLSNIRPKVRETLERGGYMKKFGLGHIFECKTEAIPAIVAKLDRDRCSRCTARIFRECPQKKMENVR